MAGLSEERLAPANGIELAYQEVGDPAADPILMVMGLGTQMLGWDEDFCAMIAERGFRVIRFDNRDIGHSTMIDAALVARAANVGRLFLFHHDPAHNDDFVEGMAERARQQFERAAPAREGALVKVA